MEKGVNKFRYLTMNVFMKVTNSARTELASTPPNHLARTHATIFKSDQSDF